MVDEERPVPGRARSRRRAWLPVLVLLCVAGAGCGVDDDLAAADLRAEAPAPADVSTSTPPVASTPNSSPSRSEPEPEGGTVAVPDVPSGGAWLGPMRTMGALVVAPSEEGVVAFGPATGQPAWTTDACRWPDWASHITNPDTDVAVFTCDGSHIGIDPVSGVELWRRERPADVDRTRVAGGLLLTASPTEVVGVDLVTGEEAWRWTGFGDTTATADADGYYLANDAGVTAFDKATGEARWFLPEPTSDIWAGRDAVYVRTSDHRMIKVDGASGAVLWTSLAEATRLDWSVVVGEGDGIVVLQTARDDDRFTAYDTATGEQRWTHDAPDGSTATASVSNGEFVVTDLDGGVVVMDSTTGALRCELPDAVDVAVVADRRAVVIAIEDGRQVFSLEDLSCA
jgi:outer membrane protein assembly factor BamB